MNLKNKAYPVSLPHWVSVLIMCEEWNKMPSEIEEGEMKPLSLLWELRWSAYRRAINKAHRMNNTHGKK